MNQPLQQACPLCGKPATSYVITARSKHVVCKSKCIDFVVWSGAETKLSHESETKREYLSEQARQPPDENHILVIRKPPVASPEGPALRAEFELRSKALMR